MDDVISEVKLSLLYVCEFLSEPLNISICTLFVSRQCLVYLLSIFLCICMYWNNWWLCVCVCLCVVRKKFSSGSLQEEQVSVWVKGWQKRCLHGRGNTNLHPYVFKCTLTSVWLKCQRDSNVSVSVKDRAYLLKIISKKIKSFAILNLNVFPLFLNIIFTFWQTLE